MGKGWRWQCTYEAQASKGHQSMRWLWRRSVPWQKAVMQSGQAQGKSTPPHYTTLTITLAEPWVILLVLMRFSAPGTPPTAPSLQLPAF
jgi:hypothetical protein